MNPHFPYPPWVVLHVPHDATAIPASVRDQYLLGERELERELLRMTDHYTLALFGGEGGRNVVRAPVSRLVVDVERFEDDRIEPMAAAGMGAMYALTSDLKPLRREIAPHEREALLSAYYRPHHARLEHAVSHVLAEHGRCLIIDCHSFPSVALPYERRHPDEPRPDICIGTDDFHTDKALAERFMSTFAAEGWRVALDSPFAGALVPASRYRKDRNVGSIMVEVNRGLYMDERTGACLPGFTALARKIQACCLRGLAYFGPRHDHHIDLALSGQGCEPAGGVREA